MLKEKYEEYIKDGNQGDELIAAFKMLQNYYEKMFLCEILLANHVLL